MIERSKDGRVYVRYNGVVMSRARAVWIEHNGAIPIGNFIHHKNGITDDDRIENLQCVSRKEHGLLHHLPNRIRIHSPSGAVKVIKLNTTQLQEVCSNDRKFVAMTGSL